jgi:hypothetical protein
VKKRQQVHAYAGIAWFGITPLFVASGTTGLKARFKDKTGKFYKGVSRKEYLDILTNKLLPAARKVLRGTKYQSNFVYQQDNATAHQG